MQAFSVILLSIVVSQGSVAILEARLLGLAELVAVARQAASSRGLRRRLLGFIYVIRGDHLTRFRFGSGVGTFSHDAIVLQTRRDASGISDSYTLQRKLRLEAI